MACPRPRWFRWWLFPVTSAVHFGDELFAGGGFYRYVTAFGGSPISKARFASAIVCAFLSMTLAAWVSRKRWDWVLFVLAAITLTNALTHLVQSLATRSYSPGLASGLVLWLPLGGSILYSGLTRGCAPAWWLGLAVGTAMNIAILLFTMHLGKMP
jgi:hypothetical protein